jgi:DNA-binding SARP family transcriptional activator
MRVKVSLLGALQVRHPAGGVIEIPSRKAQAVLAYLALRPGQPVARASVAALVWPDVPASRARHSLRQMLVALRQALA